MFKKGGKFGYPILNGNVLLNVNLKKSNVREFWLDTLSRRIRHYMVNRQINSYYLDGFIEDAPVINLLGTKNSLETESTLELDFNRDKIPVLSQAKVAMAGAFTAGLIVLAAWGFGNQTAGKINSDLNIGANFNSVSGSREDSIHKPPVFIVETDKEVILHASEINPYVDGSDLHRFRLSGHANSGHTNMQNPSHLNVPHTNNPPGTTHQNIVQPHTNAAQHINWSNTSGHGNLHGNNMTPHANSSDAW